MDPSIVTCNIFLGRMLTLSFSPSLQVIWLIRRRLLTAASNIGLFITSTTKFLVYIHDSDVI